ncbi:hypothetical protein AB0N17_43175 [Streptomyces sp. NPDC051133]|uniref:hypothetical protein n=1 Tax=Streptomyces sp. NPDC051133 TaxID=3155521 RepID=UPI003422E425
MREEAIMHEMWCGADASGEPVWHVLADNGLTLCGVEKREGLNGPPSTDEHCFSCMKALQAVMASTES